MDAISYSYADKQAKRIKKFINDPDSTSGVLTVPKVIASGESVTIPAGRVAILPDVQVDGTLNVLGDIFIPTGTANSKVVQKVASTDKAIPRFNGTTGDIQNSGVIIDDNNTITINNGAIKFNDNYGLIWGSGNNVYGNSSTNSVSIATVGSERMRIDSNGNVGIGIVPSAWQSGIKAFDLGNAFMHYGGGANFVMGVNAYYNIGYKYKTSGYATSYTQEDGAHYWKTAPVGSAGDPVTWNNAMTLGDTLLVGDSIERNGSVGHGQVTLTGAGTVLARPDKPTLYHKSNVGLGVHSDYAIQFEVNGTTNGAMTLNNNGNLLVGTTTDDGANKLQVNGSIKNVLQQTTVSDSNSGVFADTVEYTKTYNSNAGAGIAGSVFGDVPMIGELYAIEHGTGKYLRATIFKASSSANVDVTVHASSGLALVATNSGGTIQLGGYTVGSNVRMMTKLRKIY